jgi:hypothetical protein
MARPRQSYADHRRYFPLFHFVVQPLLIVNVLIAVTLAVRAPSFERAWAAVLAVALVLASAAARLMALTVQNRVIRLEQRLRFARVLGPAEQHEAEQLGLRQILALRFASDAELPGLVQRAAAGELTSPDAIKRAVTSWQPDHLRV